MSKLSYKERRDATIEAFGDQDIFTVKNVMAVNHKPHAFMIGTRHIKHASDNYGGMLGEETLREIPCAMKNCNVPYDEHTADDVCFLQLRRDANSDEVTKLMKKVVDTLGEQYFDGFCFVETEAKYRVI